MLCTAKRDVLALLAWCLANRKWCVYCAKIAEQFTTSVRVKGLSSLQGAGRVALTGVGRAHMFGLTKAKQRFALYGGSREYNAKRCWYPFALQMMIYIRCANDDIHSLCKWWYPTLCIDEIPPMADCGRISNSSATQIALFALQTTKFAVMDCEKSVKSKPFSRYAVETLAKKRKKGYYIV